jgi:hypothetical protein
MFKNAEIFGSVMSDDLTEKVDLLVAADGAAEALPVSSVALRHFEEPSLFVTFALLQHQQLGATGEEFLLLCR